MVKNRLIAVVIIRDNQVVQSVKFKHTNVIHYDAIHAIETFNQWSVDEIVLLNVSPNQKTKADFLKLVERVSRSCFVPLSVGGWIDEFKYAVDLIRNGADKLVVNTACFTNSELIQELITHFGSQCVVASIDFDYVNQVPTVLIDRGTRDINVSPDEWAKKMEVLGVGEIFLNCVSRDGARKGYDLEMVRKVSDAISIPLIAFGGVLRWQHLLDGIHAGASAVAAANVFHYTEHAAKRAKEYLYDEGVNIRTPEFMNE